MGRGSVSVDSPPPPVRRVAALDGLRGVAVVAVLLFHAGYASGGFLGVDTFFVLSGFLITSLLLAEHRRTGTIDLVDFWRRRIRRLLPALLLTMVGAVAYAVAVAPRTQMGRIAGDGLASLGYVANWRFVLVGETYGDLLSAPSPLRHLWSLAVEEQWYLLWPIVTVVVLRVARGSRRALGAVAASAAIASMGLLALFAGTSLTRAYYGTDTRAFALLFGVLLALAFERHPEPATGARRVVGALAVPGAAVLVALFFTVGSNDRWLYRGGGLPLAAASAAAVVAAAWIGAGLLPVLLRWRPLVAVGERSYGLYLVHWPVFLWLTPGRTGLRGLALFALRVAVSSVLTEVSLRVVELPVRERRIGLRPVLASAALVGVLLVPLAIRAPDVRLHSVTVAAASPGASGDRKLLIVGDSVGFSLLMGWPHPAGWHLDADVIVGCGVQEDQISTAGRVLARNPTCADWRDRWRHDVAVTDPAAVVVSLGAWEVEDQVIDGRRFRFPSPALDARVSGQLDDAVTLLSARGARVAFLSSPCFDQPDDGVNVPGAERNDITRVRHFNELLRAAAARHPGVASVLPVGETMCPGGRFAVSLDGVRVRSDGMHYTVAGAQRIWASILPALR